MPLKVFTALFVVALALSSVSTTGAHDLSESQGCRVGDTWVPVATGHQTDSNNDLQVCMTKNGRLYDNHAHQPKNGGGWTDQGCRQGDTLVGAGIIDPVDENQDLVVCREPDGDSYDNRLPKEPNDGGGWTDEGCRQGDTLVGVVINEPVDENQDLVVCREPDGGTYDNRLE